MYGHAWIYNNIEIIIKIIILFTNLNRGHYGGRTEEEGCPDSPDNFIKII